MKEMMFFQVKIFIKKATFKRLWGIHFYGILFDRNEEPQLGNTLKGTSEYSNFEYVCNENTFSNIKCSLKSIEK